MYPSNSYVEGLTPSVMVLGSGAFGRWLGLEWSHVGNTLMMGFISLYEETRDLSVFHVKIQQEGECAQANRSALAKPWPCSLPFDSPGCTTVGDRSLLFEPSGLWYFATAAGAKTKSNLGSFACVCVCVCVCRFWAAGGLASLSGLLFLPRRTLIKSNAFPSLHEELDLRDN